MSINTLVLVLRTKISYRRVGLNNPSGQRNILGLQDSPGCDQMVELTYLDVLERRQQLIGVVTHCLTVKVLL